MKERAGKTRGSYCIRTGIERGLGTTGSVEPWRFTKSGSATGSLSRPNQQKKDIVAIFVIYLYKFSNISFHRLIIVCF